MAQHVEHRQPRSEDASSAIADWIVRIRAHRKLLRRIGVGVSFLIISVSTFIFAHTLISIDPRNFEAAFAATGADQIAMAFGFTTLSYVALTGYDGLALRHLNARVPYRLTALASFTSYAISFTLGFPLVTAGAVRYWLYSSAGLSAGKVASLTVVAGVTFWLGMGLVLALGFIVDAVEIGEINHLASWANQAIGLGLLAVLCAYLVWVTRMRRQGKGAFLNFKLPGPVLTLGQTGLGAIDVCSAAGALFVLLPKGHALGYMAFCSLYSFAAMLGIASHSPGGLGVFEATMLKGVGGSSEQLLASLLLFRAIYYLVPFLLALALLGANEAARRWRSLREAMATTTFNGED
jgi:uncharacterized membrane protein YbhN (UPF0104 family)